MDTPNGRVHVPCGRCEACNALKGYSAKTNLDICLSYFPCVYLVTLTYNDKYLPFASWDDDEFAFVGSDVDYHGNNYRSDYGFWCDDEVTLRYLDVCKSRYDGRLPVLSHSDVILFKKRFRKNFAKISNEKVCIYVCAEYSPKEFRPHYHLLLCFKSLQSECAVTDCVRASWSCRVRYTSAREEFGFVSVQYCTTASYSSYVSSYLNCVIGLPKILLGQFRPFRQSFRQSDIRQSYFEFDEYEYFCKPCFEKSCRSSDGLFVVARVPSFLQNRVFPLHKAFDCIDIQGRLRVAKFCSLFDGFKSFYDYVVNAFDGGFALSFIRDVIMRDVRDVRLCLYKFWLVFRRYVANSCTYNVSLYDYFLALDNFRSRRELFKLSKFYDFLEDFSRKHKPFEVSSLYYDSPQLYDYRNISEYKYFASKCRDINFNNAKTKKRNSYFASRGWRRPSFYNSKIKSYLL